MPPKRNSLGQFVAKDSYNSLYLELPGPLKLFKYLVIFIAISPWIFVILFRIDVRGYFKNFIEWIFGINEGETKNKMDFFDGRKMQK